MLIIRPDAQDRLTKAMDMISAIRRTNAPELIAQHLNGIERILEQLRSSLISTEETIESNHNA